MLAKALPEVAFEGWSKNLLQQAIATAEIDSAMAELAFARGVDTLIETFSAQGDNEMLAVLPAPDDMKIRARITEAVWQRVLVDSAHIEAASRGGLFIRAGAAEIGG